MSRLLNIAVVYSLPSSRMKSSAYSDTDLDSGVIAEKVAQGLSIAGFEPKLYPIGEDEISDLAKIQADCVFNLIEWCGRDIELASLAFSYLRKLNIPVTGSDEKMFVLTGDKTLMKQELIKLGIPTPLGIKFVTGEEVIDRDLPYPMLVKPSLEHCSMGIGYESIAHSPEELRAIVGRQIEEWKQPVLAEEFIVGREFLVYMYEVRDKVVVLPIEEILFIDNDPAKFQTYQTKWEVGSSDYKSTFVDLAELGASENQSIEELCVKTFKELGLRGYARFDIRYRDGVPYVLETNANPSVYDGDGEESDLNTEVIWGIKFPDYLKAIVESAIYHFELGERI